MGLLDRFKKDKEEEERLRSSVGQQSDQDYKPPPGPPPSYQTGYASSSNYPQQTKADTQEPVYREPEYAPPPGPPPAYHDWQAIPDTSLLPPPPTLGKDTSDKSNADSFQADRAREWTDQNPPFRPDQPHQSFVDDVRRANITLRAPEHPERGEICVQNGSLCHVKTTTKSKDHSYLSSLPLYFETVDSPFRTEVSKIIYYEIKIENMKRLRDGSDSSVAIGYCVAPYPTWRMPGWQRGSLAVHSDDGARYMSHDGGGFDFTESVQVGETIGIGIRFSVPQVSGFTTIDAAGQPLKGEVFFTRRNRHSGRIELAGGWDIQEGLDAEDAWRADFLDGKWDLYAAVGTYGEVEISVNFGAQQFEFNPHQFRGL